MNIKKNKEKSMNMDTIDVKTPRKLKSPKECLDNNGNKVNSTPNIISDISKVFNMVEKLDPNSSNSSNSSESDSDELLCIDNNSPEKDKSISKYPYYTTTNSKNEMINKMIDILKILSQLVEKIN